MNLTTTVILLIIYMSLSSLLISMIRSRMITGDDDTGFDQLLTDPSKLTSFIEDSQHIMVDESNQDVQNSVNNMLTSLAGTGKITVENQKVMNGEIDAINLDQTKIVGQFAMLALISQNFVYQLRSVIGKVMGSITVLVNLINSTQYTALSIWNGPLGKAVGFVDGL